MKKLHDKFKVAHGKICDAHSLSQSMSDSDDVSRPKIHQLTRQMRAAMSSVTALEVLAVSGKQETLTKE